MIFRLFYRLERVKIPGFLDHDCGVELFESHFAGVFVEEEQTLLGADLLLRAFEHRQIVARF